MWPATLPVTLRYTGSLRSLSQRHGRSRRDQKKQEAKDAIIIMMMISTQGASRLLSGRPLQSRTASGVRFRLLARSWTEYLMVDKQAKNINNVPLSRAWRRTVHDIGIFEARLSRQGGLCAGVKRLLPLLLLTVCRESCRSRQPDRHDRPPLISSCSHFFPRVWSAHLSGARKKYYLGVVFWLRELFLNACQSLKRYGPEQRRILTKNWGKEAELASCASFCLDSLVRY